MRNGVLCKRVTQLVLDAKLATATAPPAPLHVEGALTVGPSLYTEQGPNVWPFYD